MYPYLSSPDEHEPDWPAPAARDRVTHLVFVDGRLVDHWREPASGTEWAPIAAEHDRSQRPPEPPPKPLHVRVQEWLVDVCGGAAALEALDCETLTDDLIDLPSEYADRAGRDRMEATAELLDSVATRLFDAETSYAFRHALLALWADDPDTVLRASSAAQLAAGICWAIGKANGTLSPVGPLRVGSLQDALALRSTPSSYGGVVRGALRGFRGRPLDRWERPPGVPDLLALGRTDVLLGSTRERLVRIRDRARAAAA